MKENPQLPQPELPKPLNTDQLHSIKGGTTTGGYVGTEDLYGF